MHRPRPDVVQQRRADRWTVVVFALFGGAGLVLLASPRPPVSTADAALDWTMVGVAGGAVLLSWLVRWMPWSVRLALPAIMAAVLVLVLTRW